MTALLTSKNKYGLDPDNLTSPGISPSSETLRQKDMVSSHDEPAQNFRTDCGVEGLSLGCSLLKVAIEVDDEGTLRRLLALGTSAVAEDDSFFWQVVRYARKHPDQVIADAEKIGYLSSHDGTPEETATILTLRNLGNDDLDSDFNLDMRDRISRLLVDYYSVPQNPLYCTGRDVLEHFAVTGNGRADFFADYALSA